VRECRRGEKREGRMRRGEKLQEKVEVGREKGEKSTRVNAWTHM